MEGGWSGLGVLWEDTGVYGSGENVEGTATRVPDLSPSPILQMPFLLGGALPSYGIILEVSNSPTLWSPS